MDKLIEKILDKLQEVHQEVLFEEMGPFDDDETGKRVIRIGCEWSNKSYLYFASIYITGDSKSIRLDNWIVKKHTRTKAETKIHSNKFLRSIAMTAHSVLTETPLSKYEKFHDGHYDFD